MQVEVGDMKPEGPLFFRQPLSAVAAIVWTCKIGTVMCHLSRKVGARDTVRCTVFTWVLVGFSKNLTRLLRLGFINGTISSGWQSERTWNTRFFKLFYSTRRFPGF